MGNRPILSLRYPSAAITQPAVTTLRAASMILGDRAHRLAQARHHKADKAIAEAALDHATGAEHERLEALVRFHHAQARLWEASAHSRFLERDARNAALDAQATRWLVDNAQAVERALVA